MLAHASAPEHLTLQEAADWLRETERSTRRRIAAGQLPAYRVGTKRLIVKRADVEALLVPIAAGSAQ